MGQRATRRGRPHCEAFPTLDIVQGERSLRAGDGEVTWLDESGRVVGRGRLLELSGTRAVFSYAFVGSRNISRAEAIISLRVFGTRRNPDVVRKSFECPGCAERAEKLFFVEESWSCRSCHNLVHLSQRLGKVNKEIHQRDMLLSRLDQASAVMQHTREYHNKRRHLDRLNRELAARDFFTLPQELLFRTHQVWEASSGTALTFVDRSRDAAADDVAQTDIAVDLAFYRPPPPPTRPLVPSELIGSVILGRPWEPFLTRYNAEQAGQLANDFGLAGSASINVPWITAELAERIELRPIVLTSDWSGVEETIGPEGQAEYSISATYAGDGRLWPAGPCAKPYKRVLRAILDAPRVTLRVRAPAAGRANPEAELVTAAAELERRLASVEDKAARFNAERVDQARRWLARNWKTIIAASAIVRARNR